MRVSCTKNNWKGTVAPSIRDAGYIIVEDILTPADVEMARSKLYAAQQKIVNDIGREKLLAANEHGVLRLIMKFEPYFLSLLEIPALLSTIDTALADTAILHVQNGFILASSPENRPVSDFQNHFHRDFPRYLNGYMASINILLAIDAFTPDNGGTVIVPATHQKAAPPDKDYLAKHAVALSCPAGSAIVFDSTLWHCSGVNLSGKDRLAINHQFTRSFMKQQIDYVRALGEDMLNSLPERTRQLLGYYTRMPTSLDEYYRPENERLYRKNQG